MPTLQQIVDYLRQHKDKYPLETLKEQLRKQGVSAQQIMETESLVLEQPAPRAEPLAGQAHRQAPADPVQGMGGAQHDQAPAEAATGMQYPSPQTYFEVPVEVPVFRCSDRQCYCAGTDSLIPGETGYLHISSEVIEMRKDALTHAELESKIAEMTKNMVVAFDHGTIYPIFMCREAAQQRGLDLDVAASDAKHWASTGQVPLRMTPRRTSSSAALDTTPGGSSSGEPRVAPSTMMPIQPAPESPRAARRRMMRQDELDAASLSARDELDAALLSAAHDSNLQAIQDALRNGADVNTRSEHDRETPLHRAAGKGNVDACRILLAAGADPNAEDYLQNTPAYSAALYADRCGDLGAIVVDRVLGDAASDQQREDAKLGVKINTQEAIYDSTVKPILALLKAYGGKKPNFTSDENWSKIPIPEDLSSPSRRENGRGPARPILDPISSVAPSRSSGRPVPCIKCGLEIPSETVERTGGFCSGCDPASPAPSQPRKSKKACFIATACYGSADSPEVMALRRFRDKHLLPTDFGRRFVGWYYRISPPLAGILSRRPLLRRLARSLLRPVVSLAAAFPNRTAEDD